MKTKNYSAEKKRIEKEIERLQKRAQDLQRKQREPIISQIVRQMKEYGIDMDELARAYGAKRRGRKAATKAPKQTTRGSVAAKYRNPETMETWTGRGKTPRWIMAAEQEGRSRDEFLIDSSTLTTPTAEVDSTQ